MPALERNIQTAIVTAVKARGAWVVNMHGSQFGRAGVPDLILCYRGLFVALEVKQPGKRPKPLQRHEISMIRRAGGTAEIVTSKTEAIAVLDLIDERMAA